LLPCLMQILLLFFVLKSCFPFPSPSFRPCHGSLQLPSPRLPFFPIQDAPNRTALTINPQPTRNASFTQLFKEQRMSQCTPHTEAVESKHPENEGLHKREPGTNQTRKWPGVRRRQIYPGKISGFGFWNWNQELESALDCQCAAQRTYVGQIIMIKRETFESSLFDCHSSFQNDFENLNATVLSTASVSGVLSPRVSQGGDQDCTGSHTEQRADIARRRATYRAHCGMWLGMRQDAAHGYRY
jgi:hypothetical protein